MCRIVTWQSTHKRGMRASSLKKIRASHPYFPWIISKNLLRKHLRVRPSPHRPKFVPIHPAEIRVYDEVGNVIETHERGDYSVMANGEIFVRHRNVTAIVYDPQPL